MQIKPPIRVLLVLGTVALLASCGGSSFGGKTVRLVAYSTPQAAFAALIPAFQATPAGRGVTFTTSYGASGDQSRAVLAGLPADVVDLSLEPDVTKLVKAGLVATAWNQNATHGFVTDSVAVFVVRPGNPKHIATWDDLVKPGGPGGDSYLRPHDIQILPDADETAGEALVERIVHLGFEVRVELKLDDGREVWAQLTRERAALLELEQGQLLAARLGAPRVFA